MSESVISFIFYCAGTFLAITAPAWMILYSNRKKKIIKPMNNQLILESVVIGDLPERLSSVDMSKDVCSQIIESSRITTADAEYAEELQFQEALLVSLVTAAPPNDAFSSVQEHIPNPEMLNYEQVLEDSPLSFCEICLENKESWQMFENDKCLHSFCYECTSNHVISKIRENLKIIPCPALYCKTILNFEACQMMVPDDILVKWHELLCLSLIPDSQKLYCPFLDCSALLVNDSGAVLKKIECVSCKRSFCAECHVPWHSEFTCKEFQKLYARKGRGKDEKIVKKLAEKKNWMKCPKCKMYIEKAEGCAHMTCRCEHEFCYRCGSKWTENHGGCKQKR
ncbi:E3 ubiquitin-protein ligase RSL1-like isoform X1 [Primulina tabacum]|uniref:E3 ubiquitin-protein ligase RSL1-like isoform X1 n=1 Tax=Primulina tabacum TaxID=48773 RepID=UPI003F5A7405